MIMGYFQDLYVWLIATIMTMKRDQQKETPKKENK